VTVADIDVRVAARDEGALLPEAVESVLDLESGVRAALGRGVPGVQWS
jgi:hypothetical protein